MIAYGEPGSTVHLHSSSMHPIITIYLHMAAAHGGHLFSPLSMGFSNLPEDIWVPHCCRHLCVHGTLDMATKTGWKLDGCAHCAYPADMCSPLSPRAWMASFNYLQADAAVSSDESVCFAQDAQPAHPAAQPPDGPGAAVPDSVVVDPAPVTPEVKGPSFNVCSGTTCSARQRCGGP